MPSESIQFYQADMRTAYAYGAPGVLVSGIVWLAAAATVLTVSVKAGIWVLMIGGMAIFPLSLLGCRVVGASGKHSRGNPLGFLAIEGTVWLMAGIFISLAATFAGTNLLFPIMLLVIGSRYLTFQTLYGIRKYWFAGGALCIAGFAAPALQLPSWISAAAGAGIEVVLAAALFMQRKRDEKLN
jgi:hypothetical protein